MFSPYQISCICMRPWKKCVNKRVCKKLNDYVWYDTYPPYTLGMAELGYEYDFLNNRRVADKCPFTVLRSSKNSVNKPPSFNSEIPENRSQTTTTVSYWMKHSTIKQ